MSIYSIALYTIILGGALINVALSLLNLSRLSTTVPTEFAEYFSIEKYAKSRAYIRSNIYFGIFETMTEAAALSLFIFCGGFAFVDTMARASSLGSIGTGLVFAGILWALSKIASIPFSLYHTFVIEERFGFNKTTLRTYMSDLVKEIILTVLLGGLVFAGILWFFESVGQNAWLWCWVALTAFQVFLLFLAPAFIMPLFNKFTPLEDGELKDAIEAYAKSQNFKLQGIYKMDGSKRSTKANAYFTGFGKYRRVVLFDTLIKQHTVPELVSILAHEIGHFKHKHIFKQMLLGLGTLGVMFYLLQQFINNPEIFSAFGVQKVSIYASIIFFGILYSPLSAVISLVSLHFSRRYEFEADAYAAKTYGQPQTMQTALKKLTAENFGNLTPHPLAVFFRYTHPPTLERLRALESFGLCKAP